MTQADRYFIGPGLRVKLREVIGRVDGMAYGDGGGGIPTRLQGMDGRGGGGGLKIGTFAGSWPKGTTHTVTLINATATTHAVSNVFSDISVDCGTRKCAIARDGTVWYLIQAEC